MSARPESFTRPRALATDRAKEPNFYLLPFASQMIVWAMRKSLNTAKNMPGDPDDQVMNVFSMADWSELYLHPNAVAHLRYGRRDEAILSLCSMLPPTKARLVLPHAAAVATHMKQAGLPLAIVATASLHPGRDRTPAITGSVH